MAKFSQNVMTIRIDKPILITGVSLSFLLWFWQSLQASLNQIGEISLWGLIALSIVFLFLQPQKTKSQSQQKSYTSINQAQLEQAFTDTEILINKLIEEEEKFPQINNQNAKTLTEPSTEAKEECAKNNHAALNSPELNQILLGKDLLSKLEQLKSSVSREKIQVAIAGRKKAGKSSLKQFLVIKYPATDIEFLEAEDWSANFNNQDIDTEKLYLGSDLIIFIVNGDLTDSEWQILQKINHHNQRTLLIFNQKDRYLPEEQILLLQQLQLTVKPIIPSENVIAISTNPNTVKVRKHQEDGVIQESLEKPQADLNQFFSRLEEIITNERQQLVLSTTYRQAIALKTEAKNRLNEIRRQQALPIIEQYQWMAAAAAFANPVSSLDLLATAAINTQMLVDLSNIYQQKFSLSQAQTASISLAKLMVKLGIVEISTQTIGSMLKSNAITYLAGGLVQGVSSAYLTHVGGLSLIEYFQTQETANNKSLNLKKLQKKLQAIFQENQRTAFLKNFVTTAASKI